MEKPDLKIITQNVMLVLSLDILDQNFCYCLYISKTGLSCVLVWTCWKCDVTNLWCHRAL